MMDGINMGFKTASNKFEKIINAGEWIFDNTNMILEILLEEQHSIVVMVVARTMSVLVVVSLFQSGYLVKLNKQIKNKESQADALSGQKLGVLT